MSTSITRRGYGFPSLDWRGALSNTRVDQPSPDGSRFYILTDWGDEACGCAMQRLDVYRTDVVERWLAQNQPGVPIAERSLIRRVHPDTRLRGNAIAFPRWTRAGDAIRFMGTNEAGEEQYFQFEVASGELRPLTNEVRQIYNIQFSDTIVAYMRMIPGGHEEGASPPIVVAPRQQVATEGRAIGDISIDFLRGRAHEFVAKTDGRPEWVMPLGGAVSIQIWYAPDERRAVIITIDSRLRPIQFFLADFGSRSLRHIASASTGSFPYALWFSDSARVAISGLRRPVRHTAGTESNGDGMVGVFDTRTSLLTEIGGSARNGGALAWAHPDNELILTSAAGRSRTAYSLHGDEWVETRPGPASATSNAPAPGLAIRIRQDANTPPRLFAMANGIERPFDEPDPALAGVDIIAQQQYSWAMRDGTRLTGGLLLPRSRRPGERVPLVVEVGNHYPQLFLPDGQVPTWYAPQLLAANGFAVLELNSFDLPGMQTRAEGEQFTARLEAALDALDREGIIDPGRVGLIGHSRAGWVTHYAITHPVRHAIRTAEIIDAVTASYSEYLSVNATDLALGSGFEEVNGGSFWSNREAWIQNDVLFNVHRVRGSTLFVDHGFDGRTADVAGWHGVLPVIGAYRLNHKPIDYVFVPRGGHTLTSFPDRRAAMTLSLDWMQFWLMGREDPDPTKADQYARWRMMRDRERRPAPDEQERGAGGNSVN